MKYINRIASTIRDKIVKEPKNTKLAFQTALVAATAVFLLIARLFVPTPQVEAYTSDLGLDLESDFPLVSEDSKPEIKLVQSEYEKRQAGLAARTVIPRSVPARAEGVSFEQKRALVKQTAAKYGIDWKILEAVWQVETGKSWDTSIRSYAGAIGPMQFMPGTFRDYSQDGNGDGRADIYKAEDALASAANLLAQSGLKDGKVDKALLNYNYSMVYVAKVKRIANSIAE
jgi:membrane-bound lytic murein transglycosylase B